MFGSCVCGTIALKAKELINKILLFPALPCPAYCPQNETKAGVSIVENEIVGKCVRSCLQVKRCAREQTSPPRIFIRDREREPRRPERVRPPSPPRAAVPRPKLELNLAPPPPLERVERVSACNFPQHENAFDNFITVVTNKD